MGTTRNSTSIALIFIWIGFLGAISFMEAWLKFQAPGITLELGLGIGKLVFGALNKMEWIFSIIISLNLLINRQNLFKGINLLLIASVAIVALQSFWLLPALFDRAEMHIQQQGISSSSFVHYFYISIEVLKTIFLIILGVSWLRKR